MRLEGNLSEVNRRITEYALCCLFVADLMIVCD